MHTGIANATTGGWGNLGGGVTQLLMPLVFRGISNTQEPFIAWRYAMFVPAFMHIVSGILILFFSSDLPDGNYAILKKSGGMKGDSPLAVMLTAVLNYRHATALRSFSLSDVATACVRSCCGLVAGTACCAVVLLLSTCTQAAPLVPCTLVLHR